jgi:hypothetical protein
MRAKTLAPTKHAPIANTSTTTSVPRTDWTKKQGNDDFNRER